MYELVSLVMSAAAVILITLLAFWLYIGLPWDMAKARKRQPLLWVLISIVGSPFLAIILLWWLGEAEV